MRRWAVYVVLVVTVFLQLQPMFASVNEASSVPACCRRNGKHHCVASLTKAFADHGKQFTIAPSPCSQWRLGVAPVVVATVAAPIRLSSCLTAGEAVALSYAAPFLTDPTQSKSTRAPPAASL